MVWPARKDRTDVSLGEGGRYTTGCRTHAVAHHIAQVLRYLQSEENFNR